MKFTNSRDNVKRTNINIKFRVSCSDLALSLIRMCDIDLDNVKNLSKKFIVDNYKKDIRTSEFSINGCGVLDEIDLDILDKITKELEEIFIR